jgi:hypothetical protein
LLLNLIIIKKDEFNNIVYLNYLKDIN